MFHYVELENFLYNFSDQKIDKYDHIRVEFFPSNCTSKVQPLEQGIIQAFKAKYQSQVVTEKLDAIDYGYELSEIDIYNSIKKIYVAWKNVSEKTIQNCFKKAGFKEENSQESVEKDEKIDAEMINFKKICQRINIDCEEFLNIDIDLLASETLSD